MTCAHTLYHVTLRTDDMTVVDTLHSIVTTSCADLSTSASFTLAYPHHSVSGIVCQHDLANVRQLVADNVAHITQYVLVRI